MSLADTDLHGYAIRKDVGERTDGRVTLSTGTLYGLIQRLLADGLIVESRRRPPAADDDARRRYYRLTPFGRAVAVAEMARLESAVLSARKTGIVGKARA